MRLAAWILVAWFMIACFAVLNGALREFVLVPGLGPLWGGLISALLLSCVVLVGAGWIIRRLHIGLRDAGWLWISCAWLVMTLTFEFGVGRLRGLSWDDLLADYNLLDGRFWLLVVISIAVGPGVLARLIGNGRGPLRGPPERPALRG